MAVHITVEQIPAEMTLGDICEHLTDLADEIRWRMMDVTNPLYEDAAGQCRHRLDIGCSWRCPRRTKGVVLSNGEREVRSPTNDEVRKEILRLIGPILFCVLDAHGESVERLEEQSVLMAIEHGPLADG